MKALFSRLLVQPSEIRIVLYFLGLFILIGTGMALGRATAETLLFKRYGIENLPYIYIGLSVSLAALSLLYAAFADRLRAEKFIIYLAIIATVSLVGIWLIIQNGIFSGGSYPVYFIVYEIISELFLVHCSVYLAQNFTHHQSKRLIPLVLSGNQLGVLLGGISLPVIVQYVGVENIIPIWAALLLLTAAFTIVWHLKNGASPYFQSKPKKSGQIKQATHELKTAYKFSMSSPLLKANSLAIFFLVISFYTMYYIINKIYNQAFPDEQSLASFFGYLTALTGVLTLLTQILITNKLIERFSIKNLNLIYPLTTLTAFIALSIFPGLVAAIIGSINKDTVMGSIRNPIQTIFYNALPNHMQGRSRALSIIIIIPLALVFCAALIYLGNIYDSYIVYCLFGIATSVLYLYYSGKMNASYFSGISSSLAERFNTTKQSISSSTLNVRSIHSNHLNKQDDSAVYIASFKLLLHEHPEIAIEFLTNNLDELPIRTLNTIIQMFTDKKIQASNMLMRKLISTSDLDLKSSVLHVLINNNERSLLPYLKEYDKSNNTDLRAIALYGIILLHDSKDKDLAITELSNMLSGAKHEMLSALKVSSVIDHLDIVQDKELVYLYHDAIKNYMFHNDEAVLIQSLRSLTNIKTATIPDSIVSCLNKFLIHTNPEIRSLSVSCISNIKNKDKMQFLEKIIISRNTTNIKNAFERITREADKVEEITTKLLIEKQYYIHPHTENIILKILCEHGLDKAILTSLAQQYADLSLQYLLIHESLLLTKQDLNSPCNLSFHTSKERAFDYCSLAITALGYIESYTDFDAIYNAAISGDAQYSAKALEILSQSQLKDVSEKISDVILFKSSKTKKYNHNEMISLCKLQNDQWLQSCLNKCQPK